MSTLHSAQSDVLVLQLQSEREELRTQNAKLWAVIEKQRSVLTQLQQKNLYLKKAFLSAKKTLDLHSIPFTPDNLVLAVNPQTRGASSNKDVHRIPRQVETLDKSAVEKLDKSTVVEEDASHIVNLAGEFIAQKSRYSNLSLDQISLKQKLFEITPASPRDPVTTRSMNLKEKSLNRSPVSGNASFECSEGEEEKKAFAPRLTRRHLIKQQENNRLDVSSDLDKKLAFSADEEESESDQDLPDDFVLHDASLKLPSLRNRANTDLKPKDSNDFLSPNSAGSSGRPSVNDISPPLFSLKGINVCIVSSSIKHSEEAEKEAVVFYTFSIRRPAASFNSQELWQVVKTFNDVSTLESRLRSVYGKATIAKAGKLPDRMLFIKHMPQLLQTRRQELERYINNLILTVAVDAPDLLEFLSTDLVKQDDSTAVLSIYKKGYLIKRGKSFGGWKTRYFELKNNALVYYESKGGNMLGFIPLSQCQIAKQEVKESSKSVYCHAFMIIERKSNGRTSKHILCADSDQDRDDWLASISFVVTSNHAAAGGGGGQDDCGSSTTAADLNRSTSCSSSSTANTANGGEPSVSPNRPKPKFKQDAVLLRTNDYSSEVESRTSGGGGGGGNRKKKSLANEEQLRVLRPSISLTELSSQARTMAIAPIPPLPSLPAEHTATDSDSSFSLNTKRENKRRTGIFRRMFQKSEDISRTQFGIPLEQAVANTRNIMMGLECPAVVYRCIEYLEQHKAEKEEGIYRLSGSSNSISQLKAKFNEQGDYVLTKQKEKYDLHAIAGLLKLFLRELPESLFTTKLHNNFTNVIDLPGRAAKVNELGRLVSELPVANYTVLRMLVAHLIGIVSQSEVNLMTVRNIGIVFSPTLGVPAGVFVLMIVEFDYVFYVMEDGSAAPKQLPQTEQHLMISDVSTNRSRRSSKSSLVSSEAPPPPTSVVRSERSNRNSKIYKSFNPSLVKRETNLIAVLEEKKHIKQDDYEDMMRPTPTTPRSGTEAAVTEFQKEGERKSVTSMTSELNNIYNDYSLMEEYGGGGGEELPDFFLN